MDLTATREDADHVVTLFRRDGCWGAISKSNHVWLRWRDPVYRSLRELAMSYFHEYFNSGRKTLRTYSVSIDLRRFAPDIMQAAQRTAVEITEANAAADAGYRKVYEAWKQFRDASHRWFATAEHAYAEFAYAAVTEQRA